MTLLNAPEYDERGERRRTGSLIGIGVLLLLTAVIGVGGYLLGHGWFFSLLPVEHRINVSKTDGTGPFGTGIIVAVRVNGDHKIFMWYERKDGTLTYPAPHELEY